jgi:hypothetical protein
MKLINPKAIILLLATLTYSISFKIVIYDPFGGYAGHACEIFARGKDYFGTAIEHVYLCIGLASNYYPCRSYTKDNINYNIIEILEKDEAFIGGSYTSPHEVITLHEETQKIRKARGDIEGTKNVVVKCAENLQYKIDSLVDFKKTKKLK